MVYSFYYTVTEHQQYTDFVQWLIHNCDYAIYVWTEPYIQGYCWIDSELGVVNTHDLIECFPGIRMHPQEFQSVTICRKMLLDMTFTTAEIQQIGSPPRDSMLQKKRKRVSREAHICIVIKTSLRSHIAVHKFLLSVAKQFEYYFHDNQFVCQIHAVDLSIASIVNQCIHQVPDALVSATRDAVFIVPIGARGPWSSSMLVMESPQLNDWQSKVIEDIHQQQHRLVVQSDCVMDSDFVKLLVSQYHFKLCMSDEWYSIISSLHVNYAGYIIVLDKTLEQCEAQGDLRRCESLRRGVLVDKANVRVMQPVYVVVLHQ
jgi:hypothetical protein